MLVRDTTSYNLQSFIPYSKINLLAQKARYEFLFFPKLSWIPCKTMIPIFESFQNLTNVNMPVNYTKWGIWDLPYLKTKTLACCRFVDADRGNETLVQRQWLLFMVKQNHIHYYIYFNFPYPPALWRYCRWAKMDAFMWNRLQYRRGILTLEMLSFIMNINLVRLVEWRRHLYFPNL